MTTEPSPAPPHQGAKGERLTADTAQTIINGISLEQALLDVEVANARVIDLTQRLTDAVREVQALRTQLLGHQGPLPGGSTDVEELGRQAYDLRILNEALQARLRVLTPPVPAEQPV